MAIHTKVLVVATIEPPISIRMVSDSPPSSTAKNAANTGSMLMMIAARVGSPAPCTASGGGSRSAVLALPHRQAAARAAAR